MLDNNVKIDFPCQKCGESFRVSVGQIRRGGFKCPHCGQEVNASAAKKGFADAEKLIKNFGKNFKL